MGVPRTNALRKSRPNYRAQYQLLTENIANAKSRIDVGDRLRDCKTENIHTTLVIGFRLAMLR